MPYSAAEPTDRTTGLALLQHAEPADKCRADPLLPAWRRGFSWLRSRLEGRADSEHEQAILRVILGTVATVYLVTVVLSKKTTGPWEGATLWLCAAFMAISVALLAWILLEPGTHPPRRFLGIFADVGATTAALYFNGEIAAPMFVVYLWVSFGNGFRYGIPYLAVSATLSTAGFLTVAQTEGFWRTDPYVSGGILLGLVILPGYVASLLRKLRDALARAESANEAKSQFLANISHEIRTPLHGILGVNELLLGTPLNEKQRRFADLCHRSATWLLDIVNDVLDFSKIEAGRLELEVAVFDLRRMVFDVVDLHREASRPRGLAVSCDLDPAIPERICGDPTRLRQVLNNLVGNAVKFTPEGRVSLRLSVRQSSANAPLLVFEVADTGIGIAEEARERIFEPFSQADSTTTRKHGGTGLGLAIASRFVARMGGKLEVESSPGTGSVFRFALPMRRGETTASEVEAEQGAGGGSSPKAAPSWNGTPRILAAEDNPVSQELLVQFLEGFGCRVVTASNGREAVSAFQKECFDLVLMDCQMPEMDGYSAARAISSWQAAHPAENGSVPVLALTAHAGPQDRQRCLAAGMSDYLRKPFRSGELLAALQRWLPSGSAEAPQRMPPEQRAESTWAVSGETEAESDVEVRQTTRRAVHDLSNLLFAVMGNAELCRDSLPTESRERMQLDRILHAASRAVDLVAAELRPPPDTTAPPTPNERIIGAGK